MAEYADEEMSQARDALTDAEMMHRAGVTDEAVVTRLYYACFHAANAVLYAKGFDPQTHQGTLRLFGREVVKAGEAASEDGRLLNDMRSYRQTADYTHEPIGADIEELTRRCNEFVADLDALL